MPNASVTPIDEQGKTCQDEKSEQSASVMFVQAVVDYYYLQAMFETFSEGKQSTRPRRRKTPASTDVVPPITVKNFCIAISGPSQL